MLTRKSDMEFNSLSKFEARLPAAIYVSFAYNAIESFKVTKASNLISLYLEGNQLTAVPSSVFNMTALRVL